MDKLSEIVEAYYAANPGAEPQGDGWYVTLYATVPFYGGPEEGGGGGSDTSVEATAWYPSRSQAERALNAVRAAAETRSAEAKNRFGEQCLRQWEWLEARGLEDDFLPEVDGEDGYYAAIEKVSGADVAFGDRHYE